MSFKMLSLFMFVILIFNAATHPDTDPSIVFKIYSERFNGHSILTCDHNKDRVFDDKLSNYTVYEGDEFTIVTKYNETINVITCQYLYGNLTYTHKNTNMKYGTTTFLAVKSMGTLWKCTILAHLDNAVMKPVVRYKNHNYSAAYCYIQIHVRQKVAPQKIFVNNMELTAVRTDPSEKDVDFIAEYQYEDGDVVNVTCIYFFQYGCSFTMFHILSDESTTNVLPSNMVMLAVILKLTSELLNNSDPNIIFTHKDQNDNTKVMVKFVMRTNYNIVSLKINGMSLRPQLVDLLSNHYRINYKYVSNQLINVTCEVERKDAKLLVFDEDFDKVSSYKKTELVNNKKAEMSFYLHGTNKKLECAIDYFNGTIAKAVVIYFTEADFPIDKYPLHMDMQPNGRVMELNYNNKRSVIFYFFEDGETLNLTCGELHLPPKLGLYLELDSEFCIADGCTVSKQKHVTRKDNKTTIACYLKEHRPDWPNLPDIVHKEIIVIFCERNLTTTTTTTTTSTTTTALTTNYTAANPASSETPTYSSNNNTLLYFLSGLGALVIVFILVVLYYSIIKKQCCVRSSVPIPAPRINPASVFYENLLAVFKPINEREAAAMNENHYEEIN